MTNNKNHGSMVEGSMLILSILIDAVRAHVSYSCNNRNPCQKNPSRTRDSIYASYSFLSRTYRRVRDD